MNSAKLRLFFKSYWILVVLITVKMILQYILVNPIYELHRDEFLHLDQAFHPAAGYISVPPFSSWIASLIYLLGGGLFWIRFFPAFFGALTIIFAWLIVEELGGRLPARILAAIFLIFSVITRLNVLFQPNSFDILAWTMLFYFLIKYIRTQEVKWLMIFSVIMAMGVYNKYNIIFLIIGLLGGILITQHRTIFKKKAFYMALGLCLILLIPNIIWQIKNHFPVIHHMHALSESQLVNVNPFNFLFDQVKFGLIGILTLASFWGLLFYKPFKPYRFVGWTFVIVIFLYTLARAKSYYSIGLYPVLFAIGSVYLDAILKSRSEIVTGVLAVLNIALFFSVVKYLMPCQNPSDILANREVYEKIGLLRWEDGENHPLPQDFADMLGWREMAEKAFLAYKMIPSDELENTLIFCDNYGQTGALNYYNRTRMPEAYSFNTDYIHWLPDIKYIQNIVFVGRLPDQEVIDLFQEYRFVGQIENKYAREKGTNIFLLLGADPSATEIFQNEASERRRNFEIF